MMQLRQARRCLFEAFKNLQAHQMSSAELSWPFTFNRSVSHATESTLVWPPPQGLDSLAGDTEPNSSRRQPGNRSSGFNDSEEAGPYRREALRMLASNGSLGKTLTKKSLRSLRVYEKRAVLERWGYETSGLKKEDLVNRMFAAIQEEDSRRSGAAQSPNTRISTAQRAKVVPLHLSLEASQEAGVPTTRVSDASAKLQEEQEQPNAGRLKALTPAQVAEWLSDARTDDVRILDVKDLCSFADHMVLASGRSNQHVHAAASGLCWQIGKKVEGYRKANALYREGDEDSDWIAIDTGKIVVHVMTEEARSNYNLEELWSSKETSEDYQDDNESEQEEMLAW